MNKSVRLLMIVILGLAYSKDYAQNFEWANRIGSTGFEIASSLVTDASGNTYLTGRFSGTVDFDPGPGSVQLTSYGTDDVFIAKLNSSGNLVWAKQLSGSIAESKSIAVDASGNIYVVGHFQSTMDFDPGAGTYNLTATGSPSTFFCKLDFNGNLVWAKQIGAAGNAYGKSIAVDASENIYVTGYFSNTVDFDPGTGTQNMFGNAALFLMSLDANGDFRWAKRLPASGNNQDPLTATPDVAVDASSNVFTTGFFAGTGTFNPNPEPADIVLTSAGGVDVFIVKHDTYGNCLWAKRMGGTYDDKSTSIALGVDGAIYTTGTFTNTADFDPGSGTFDLIGSGGQPTFISKLDANGDFVGAYKLWGQSGDILSSSIAVDNQGNMLVGGYFSGTVDFDPGPAPFNISSVASYDGFLVELNASGSLTWANLIGGDGTDYLVSVAYDNSSNVYAAGHFQQTADFDPTSSVFNLISEGSNDLFVLKYGNGPTVGTNAVSSNSFLLYPNPATTNLTIESRIPLAQVWVNDVAGRRVITQTLKQGQGDIRIDISSLPSGIYLVEAFTQNGQRSVQKVVVE